MSGEDDMHITCHLGTNEDLTSCANPGETWSSGDIAKMLKLMASGLPIYAKSLITDERHGLNIGTIAEVSYYDADCDDLGFSFTDDRCTYASEDFVLTPPHAAQYWKVTRFNDDTGLFELKEPDHPLNHKTGKSEGSEE